MKAEFQGWSALVVAFVFCVVAMMGGAAVMGQDVVLKNDVVPEDNEVSGDTASVWFLMTSHREPEQTDGLHLAVSRDGLRWTVINDDLSVLKPEVGEVFRDPSIASGPDGTYHLVWTIAWGAGIFKGVGYTTSKDLVHWEPQRIISVMQNEPETQFVWAPELFRDTERDEWMIHWSSSVKGKFPETLHLFNGDSNPRIYYTRTKDFIEFSPSELLFDPACLAIDSYLYHAPDGRYCVFAKVDRETEPKRGILMATAPSPTGPYTVDPQMITDDDEGWAEGPSALVVPTGDGKSLKTRLYYAMSNYSSVYESEDLATWKSLRGKVMPPGGYRHGTVIRIPAEHAERLMAAHGQQ